MSFRRLQLLLMAVLGVVATARAASSDLMPGSISFVDYALWDKEVRFGFDDRGTYVGKTYWYTASAAGRAWIRHKSGTSFGQLQVELDGEAHRTINALAQPSEKYGPAAASGLKLTAGSVYFDSTVTVGTYMEPFVRTDARDKLNCWIYVKEDGSVTNFMITAGRIASSDAVEVETYATDAAVVPGGEFRLTIRAIANAFPEECPGLIGFEVFVDGVKVSSDGRTVFPSAVAPTAEDAPYLHSLGLVGSSTADRINFIHSNPIDDPQYDQDDVSMLRESASLTIVGYSSHAEPLLDFPVLVRVSETNISGFHYSRCSSLGLDIRFTDENGRLLPYEIESWNPGGESLVWVKVPYFVGGAKLTMHWGQVAGTALPDNDRYAVWSDYVGVWHFALQEGRVSLEDSCGNGYTIRTDGEALQPETMIGGAAYAVSSTNSVADYSARLTDRFTFTGWYRWIDGYQNSKKIAGKNNGNVFGANVDGWSMVTPALTRACFYGDRAAKVDTPSVFPDIRANWGHVALVYESGMATAYANAAASAPTAMTISSVTNAMIMMTKGVAADEIRISKKARSADWIAAECMQATNRAFIAYGSGDVKDRENYWIEPPSVSPQPPAVAVEEAGTLVFSPGRPRHGYPVLKFYDAAGNPLMDQPTAAGTYKAVITVEDGAYEGLRAEIAFVIYERRAYRDMVGFDRIMLFNSDISPAAPVALQGYRDVDAATNAVWVHEGATWDSAYGQFVESGTHHYYYEPNTERGKLLWQFLNCRMGNLFPYDGPGEPDYLEDGFNYLPWGGFARRFLDSEKPCDNQRYAGVLLLQNRSLLTEDDEAEVPAAYSPLYTNGIGTIYFDAVNASYDCINRIKLQVCSDYWSEEEPWEAGGTGWRDLPMDVFAVVDGEYDASMSTSGVTEAVLAMDGYEGSTNCFYRIRAHVGETAAVRFRIIRSDDYSSWGADDDDPVGLIAIDNIIVSYPGMGAKISQYGAPAEPDNLVLRGQRAPFDVAFPTPEDLGRMHAQVKVDYLVNNTNEIDTSFIAAITFRYRWRYLNQLVNEWRELTLSPSAEDPHRWLSDEPILGEGAGDIEYEATAIVNAPYYEYWDYSGLPYWQWPDGYSERHPNQVIDAELDGVYSDARISPALGKDYFVRLRDGASEYEGLRVRVRRTNQNAPEAAAAVEETLDLEPSSEHTWRGFYNVLTNGLTNVFYRVELYNRQTEVGVDYQWNTNYLHGVDQRELPASDVLESGDPDQWARLPCDELTGRIMFQVDDSTFAATIIHADYQDFNAWTDARLVHGEFLGTSTETGTSGVSRLARDYSSGFSRFRESIATNVAWREAFILTGEEVVSLDGPHAINQPFGGYSRQTPNGWSAFSGMWVCERYRELGGKSLALQLDPAGYGQLTMSAAHQLPRGVEAIEFSARTAQNYDVNPFNYYNCATNDLFALSAMTFAVPCAMRVTDVDPEFHGLGSVSAVVRYRADLTGYEIRADRVASNRVEMSLYKWMGEGRQPLLVGSSPVNIPYTGYSVPGSSMGTSGLGDARLFGALLISVTNTPTSVRITAGLLAKHRKSGENYEPGLKITATTSLKDCFYYLMSWEDSADDRYTNGTVGIGSKECPAVFARPVFSSKAIPWRTDGTVSGEIMYWPTEREVSIVDESVLLNSEVDYDDWNIFASRLARKETAVAPRNLPGFKAKPLTQVVYVNGSVNGTAQMVTLATNVVSSFGFVRFRNVLRDCSNYQLQLQVGGEKSGAGVVFDEIEARQWRGEDYDDEYNPDRLLFWDYSNGAPTNFVYTTAWVAKDDGPIELAPLRTTADRVMSIRSPLMDGDRASNRGLGLGAFSFRYENADRHARLLLQVNTNGVGITSLSDVTKRLTSGWETVKTIAFDECSEEELAGGLVSNFLGLHGVRGVMRIIVDPTVVTEANNPELNPQRDPAYGRIYITMVAAKDNPRIDSGSWWGWNLKTTDEGSRQLLKDGDLDPRLYGLSYALNNSVSANTRDGDVYVTHKPFLQTPILTRGAIGEVTFKARKYSAADPPPSVAVYAMKEYDPGAKDGKFIFLTNIVVNCDRYERFTFMAPVSDSYTAFRLAVTGVEGVEGDGSPDGPGPMPESGFVRRVMLDEVAVFEAIKARLGFRKVGAFRNMLGEEGAVPNVPSRGEQPICQESWGIQAELYAVRLSEKIDYSRPPKVYLTWHEGLFPWGYERWGQQATSMQPVELKPATEGSSVYRSSLLTCPLAVMSPATIGNTVVQYSLEVVYYMTGQDVPLTNRLDASEWATPEWYSPIDYNVQYGGGQSFAAYTILDTVPWGWAWINEVNIFSREDPQTYGNQDVTNQFIEVAAPVEADLTDWRLRLLSPQIGAAQSIITNDIAIFGTTAYKTITLAATKDRAYAASNMVFFAVCSPLTKKQEARKAAGSLDGVWLPPGYDDGVMYSDGSIEYTFGLGLQLVRPSGAVEHELVAIGTNYWATSMPDFSPASVVNHLNATMPRAAFFAAGDDNAGPGKSLGVFDSFGESAEFWNNTMRETPGRINEQQFINPDHPLPIGTFITVYLNLLGDHIRQTVGDAVRTNVNQVVIVRKESAVGTNVVYDVDQWYELAEVSSSDGKAVWDYAPDVRHVSLALARESKANALTFTARAQVAKQIRDLGCDEKNPYTPAILDWLERRSFLRDVYGLGLDWPDSDGKVYLADFKGLYRDEITPMTLTQMYWLDICPTISNQCLIAGLNTPPTERIYPQYEGSAAVTNRAMGIFMMITNRIEDSASPYYAKAWPPYVLRGLAPGSNSADYTADSPVAWTDVTFKVTGILANGFTQEKNKDAWVPQRYFVFNENSFENFVTQVQVPDPRSPLSLGYSAGWGTWWREHPDDTSAVFFSWSIDTRLPPVTVEPLKANNPLQ